MKTDITPVAAELYFLPVATRMPLKFGPETLTSVTCARVRLTVRDRTGATAAGWGESPLSVQWGWPSSISLRERAEAMEEFCRRLTEAWAEFDLWGHPLEVGLEFIESRLDDLRARFNQQRGAAAEPMPHLAGLLCLAPFDLALHDAYGILRGRDVYTTYNAEFLNADLSRHLTAAVGAAVSFAGAYPDDYLVFPGPQSLPAWHLVGGVDPLDAGDRTGDEPDDGYPVLLADWIRRDGLTCLKIKLRGNDARWDYQRLVRVGAIGLAQNALWLSADFNGTVTDPAYVNDILDRLKVEHPRIYQMILYVEQPFAYDLEANRLDVHSVSARKSLFMDESAHDWRLVRLGRGLGWTGVALKTCKTQTGALLSLCWA
ncbi:MAG: hypothetical protein JW810_04310, partial [Sedimentisphaerales bacterium]|nr:hypothetical protein [Sedimentisphaerales bacterium]